MAAKKMAHFWEERLAASKVPGRPSSPRSPEYPGSPIDAQLSPMSPGRRKRLVVPRGVSAHKPPMFPPQASGRPTEVIEETIPDLVMRLSPVSSFTSAGSSSAVSPMSSHGSSHGSASVAAFRDARQERCRKEMEVLQNDVDVLDHKIQYLDDAVKRLAEQVERL